MLGKAGLGWFGRVWVVVVVGLSLRVNKKQIVTQEAKGLEKISKNFKHSKKFKKIQNFKKNFKFFQIFLKNVKKP